MTTPDGNFNNLFVSGRTDLGGSTDTSGDLRVGRDPSQGITASLSVTGSTTLHGPLTVAASQPTDLGGALRIRGPLTVDTGQAVTLGGSLSVTGDVTVSGTVDGRDVAADGTSLDQHLARSDNPHGVTAAQVGAVAISGGTITGALTVSGSVGVGTTTPVAKLQIVHTNQNANGNTLILGPTNASNLRLGYDAQYSWIQSHGSKPLAINPLGNPIGIGLTQPRTPVHVLGRIATGLDFNSAGAITFFPPDGFAWFHIDNGPAGGRPIGRLRISHGGNPGDQEIISILQNTRVGVGTTSPNVKLHVVGDRIRLTNSTQAGQYIDLRADGSALDLQSSRDLYLNNNGVPVFYRNLSKVSSRELKEMITDLSGAESTALLEDLKPVRFVYKDDPRQEIQLGFVAEDVPDIIATPDHKAINPMNIITILCGVAQEQQKEIAALQAETARLQTQLNSMRQGRGPM